LDSNFLLQNRTATKLYYDYAANLPIIDYHCHLPPDEIAANKQFSDLTEIWLKGDHYKWRAMRALGVPENLITGDTSPEAKFNAWANSVPHLLRNPLFHWTLMELHNPFGITHPLSSSTAAVIYAACNDMLAQPAFSTRNLLQHFRVEFVGTTDDPCDSLEFHKTIRDDNFSIRVSPSFRPDKVFKLQERSVFMNYIRRLSEVSGVNINSTDTLLEALAQRVGYFHDLGCRIADHGLETMPPVDEFSSDLDTEFRKFIADSTANFSNPDAFTGHILLHLCRMYHAHGWVQQFHLGAIRNNNQRLMQKIGPDSGLDSVGDFPQARTLSAFLNALDQDNQLAKTILYNNNPADNEVFATMAGNFNDGSIRGKVQFGSAWWFLDQKDGIENQLNTLSTMGVLSTFVGMITDSRSFLSYSRQDYFRRVLCSLLGDEMEKGLIPADEKLTGDLIRRVCYQNAREYFGIAPARSGRN